MKELKEILLELKDGSLRESSSIEVKRNLPNDKLLLARNIIDLANNEGGYLIIGVWENTNGIELVGVRDALSTVKTLDNVLNNLTRNATGYLSVQTINNQNIVILQVEKSKSLAYYCRKDNPLDSSSFLVVLGDFDNSHFDKMKGRLVRLGEIRRILDNAFLLTINEKTNASWSAMKVRNVVAGDDFGYCIVIRINQEFSSAWNLAKDDSEYLLNILEKIQYGKTE